MQVQATSNTSAFIAIQKNENEQSSTLFNSLISESVKPKDISYQEYKDLSVEEINRLYPKDSMGNENEKALSLHAKANFSEDETLNKVLFDFELNSKNSEASKYVNGSLNSTTWHWEALKDFSEQMKDIEKNIGLIDLPLETAPLDEKTKKAIEEDRKKWEALSRQNKPTADYLFETFKNAEKDFYQNQEYYKGSSSTFRVHGKEILAMYDSIQQEYNRRKSEENTILNSYTQNNKPNLLSNSK